MPCIWSFLDYHRADSRIVPKTMRDVAISHLLGAILESVLLSNILRENNFFLFLIVSHLNALQYNTLFSFTLFSFL